MKEIAIFIGAAVFIFFVVKTVLYIIGRLKNAAFEKSAENARVCSEPYVQQAQMNARLLGNKLHSVLKAAGFRRRSSTWNRVRGDFVDVVNLQRSQWSAKVTLNVSIVVPWIWQMRWGWEDKDFFKEEDGLVRVRAGYLIGQRDGWWDMADEGTAKKLHAVLNEHVFPYFDSLLNYAAIAERITEEISKTVPKWSDRYPFDGISPELALLAYLRGDRDRAKGMFKTMMLRDDSESLRKIYCRVFGEEGGSRG